MRRFRVPVLLLLSVISILSAGVLIKTQYLHKPAERAQIADADPTLLQGLWSNYKRNNLDPKTHRTIDYQRGELTTSEGQGYTMLRAVWSNDQTTFDQSWQWSRDNLQRGDKLFSWRWGPLGNGQYGVQTSLSGYNTATDGDSDIAVSLLQAYGRWHDQKYLTAAKQIIPSIWSNEVVLITGKPVLVSNDLERNNSDSVLVNPSYISPYAYKLFAGVDLQHNWNSLVNNSYSLLTQTAAAPLDTSSSVGLPPNWVRLNRSTGAITAAGSGLDSNYGYDAMRVSWRLAVDYEWFSDKRDIQVLSSFSHLQQNWQTGSIKAVYLHNGPSAATYESVAGYGAAMGYFSIIQPQTAKDIYNTELQPLLASGKTLDYYDDNWAWFGIALAQHALPNYTEQS